MSTLTYSSLGYSWARRDGVDEQRLHKILLSWKGTPYQSGAAFKKEGADCAGFGCGVLDEYFYLREGLDRCPTDAQFHNAKVAQASVAWMRHRYPSSRVRTMVLSPLDIIITGPAGGGPGHLLIVGPERNTLWQCSQGTGVASTGMAFETSSQEVKAVYRMALEPR